VICILTRYFIYYYQARTHLALHKDAPTAGRSSSPRRGGSCSYPKSAACTIATFAKRRSLASLLGRPVPPNGVTGPPAACSLSVTHRESARTVHGENSDHKMPVVPSRVRLAAAARMPDGHERVGRGFGEAQGRATTT
jgi:hypothetical protein